jgi:hypothetical protein
MPLLKQSVGNGQPRINNLTPLHTLTLRTDKKKKFPTKKSTHDFISNGYHRFPKTPPVPPRLPIPVILRHIEQREEKETKKGAIEKRKEEEFD